MPAGYGNMSGRRFIIPGTGGYQQPAVLESQRDIVILHKNSLIHV